MFNTVASRPYLFGNITLCVKGEPPVTVVSVTPVVAQGTFRIDSFLVRRNADELGGQRYGDGRGTLESLVKSQGSPTSSSARTGVVEGRCVARQDETSELVIQVSKSTDATAISKGVRISYDIGSADTPHQFVEPLTISLCQKGDHTAVGCH